MSAKVALVHREDWPYSDWVGEELTAVGINFVRRDCESEAELLELAADAEIVWVFGGARLITPQSILGLTACGAILRSGAGTDNIPVKEATEQGIIVANTPGATRIPVAEHAIALLLAAARRIVVHDQMVRAGEFDMRRNQPDLLIQDSSIGLVGFGQIARAVAERLRPWGAKLLACDPAVEDSQFAAFGVERVDFGYLLKTADFVTLHTPLLESTYHLIGEAQLRQMKRSAILVNTARGKVVDSVALARALREGWIQAAALDVLEEAPPGADDPVVGLPNAIITSHIAGMHRHHLHDFWRLSVDTVIDLAQRRWPLSYVNREVVPRWEMRG